MKNSELRIGNLIQCTSSMRKSQDENDYGTIGRVLEIGNDEREFEQIYCECEESFEWFFKDKYCGIPLSEKLFEILGLKKYNGVLPSYEIRIEANGFYKSLSMSYNNDNSTDQYYCWFREGDMERERHEDSIVCLRKDLKYVHEIQNLFFALTGKELINWDEIDISEILEQIENNTSESK